MRKRILIVGATGSIGRQTLDVIESMPEDYLVVGLTAHRDEDGLLSAAAPYPDAALALSGARASSPRVRYSEQEGLEELIRSSDADMVVNGAAGSGGLIASLAALESSCDLALANKESVVMAWPLLKAAADKSGAAIIPVDSEHAALFQLMRLWSRDEIVEVIITASGGAFRDRPIDRLASVDPDEAASHPNWSMGRKITIDSATMANKGLEVIEAARLFDIPPARIRVLVHPQSMVHGLVRRRDGSLYAQISDPDMRLPIQNALAWPESRPSPFGRLDLAGKSLEFRDPDPERYPMLNLAYLALELGDGAAVAYNAANEGAVAAFEARELPFPDIHRIVAISLDLPWPTRLGDLRSIFEVDAAAREAAAKAIREYR
jgi:1-deoxy-D-xylulose-5-phosphate reductoisomerase